MLLKLMSGDVIKIDEIDEVDNIDLEIPFLLKNILLDSYQINVVPEQITFFKVNEDDEYFSVFIENIFISISEDLSIKVKDYVGDSYQRFIIYINSLEYKESVVLYKKELLPWQTNTQKVFWLDYGDILIKHCSTRLPGHSNTFITAQVCPKKHSSLTEIFKNSDTKNKSYTYKLLIQEIEKHGITKELIIEKLVKFFEK